MRVAQQFSEDDLRIGLGPLAGFIGVWEGDAGLDTSPGHPDQLITETEAGFRERWAFGTGGAVENHDQHLFLLTCETNAWRKSNGDAFHEQTGYWIWDAATKQVLCNFVVPRGISIQAGGKVEPDSTSFYLRAEAGSPTYGICQTPFLDANFKVVSYDLKVELNGDTCTYEQDTVLDMKGRSELFHHTDVNTLTRQS